MSESFSIIPIHFRIKSNHKSLFSARGVFVSNTCAIRLVYAYTVQPCNELSIEYYRTHGLLHISFCLAGPLYIRLTRDTPIINNRGQRAEITVNFEIPNNTQATCTLRRRYQIFFRGDCKSYYSHGVCTVEYILWVHAAHVQLRKVKRLTLFSFQQSFARVFCHSFIHFESFCTLC